MTGTSTPHPNCHSIGIILTSGNVGARVAVSVRGVRKLAIEKTTIAPVTKVLENPVTIRSRCRRSS